MIESSQIRIYQIGDGVRPESVPERPRRDGSFHARLDELELQRLVRLKQMVEDQIIAVRNTRLTAATLWIAGGRWLREIIEIEEFWCDVKKEVDRTLEENLYDTMS